jgi:uridine monophosphate synthetase
LHLYVNSPLAFIIHSLVQKPFRKFIHFSSYTTMTTSFFAKLDARVESIDSLLCVGLDPHDEDLFPGGAAASLSDEERCEAAFQFCKTLIDATAPYTVCYKPNAAFFEALGDQGMPTLKRTLALIPTEIPILLDAKRGDIGSTATAYADACYRHLGADAVTLSPLMGWDSVSPFVTGKIVGCNERLWS